MSKTAVITTRVDRETLDLLDRLAAAQGRSRAWVVARAVERQAKQEAEFLDFLQQGIDDLDLGRSISHEELVERIKARPQSRQAA